MIYLLESSTAASNASSVILTLWWASYLSLRPLNISFASSRVGSPTVTGWNLLSKALSFSIYLRYSSVVVAPIVCSSPFAKAGFNILEASIAPSAPPAPIIVCISSINKITSFDAITSSITVLRRSSNSPLYLAPAINSDKSRVTTLLFFNSSGILPLTILCARPSAIAVFPTPGSPISTGLFFVLLLRISSILSVSSSLPITGSSFPSFAILVKSIPYSSKVAVFESWTPLPLFIESPCWLLKLWTKSFFILLKSTFAFSSIENAIPSFSSKIAISICSGLT